MIEQPPKALAIVPAFNEEGSLPSLIQEIKRKCPSLDILVINDASSDNTSEAARHAGAKVLNLPFNLGIGGAVQTGFRYAENHGYQAVIQIDGDGQHDPAYAQAVLEPVLANRLDLSIGSRFLELESFKSTFSRRLGIRFFSLLLRSLTGLPISDPTSGFRAAGVNLISFYANDYPVDYPEPEAIMMARLFRARIGEVPVKMRERTSGISSIHFLHSCYYAVKVTLAILIHLLRQKP